MTEEQERSEGERGREEGEGEWGGGLGGGMWRVVEG